MPRQRYPSLSWFGNDNHISRYVSRIRFPAFSSRIHSFLLKKRSSFWNDQAKQVMAGRAIRSVLLCGFLEKVQDGAGIILRSLLIGVVAAFGEDSQTRPVEEGGKKQWMLHVKRWSCGRDRALGWGMPTDGRIGRRSKIGRIRKRRHTWAN